MVNMNIDEISTIARSKTMGLSTLPEIKLNIHQLTLKISHI